MYKLIIESNLDNINYISNIRNTHNLDVIVNGHEVDMHLELKVVKGVYSNILSNNIVTTKVEAFIFLEKLCKDKKKIKYFCIDEMTSIAIFLLSFPQYEECFEEIVILHNSDNDYLNSSINIDRNKDIEALQILLNSNVKIKLFSKELVNNLGIEKCIIEYLNLSSIKSTKLHALVDYDFGETRGCVAFDRRSLLIMKENIELIEEINV